MRKKNERKSLSLTRRQALATMGGLSALSLFTRDPLEVLVNGLVEGVIQKAQAESAPRAAAPRNYVNILLFGAPNFYAFQPMNPYGGACQPHPYIATEFSPTQSPHAGPPRYTESRTTIGDVTLNLPPLWKNEIPVSSGGTVPMLDLLKNMIFMRGFDSRTDSHDDHIYYLRPLPDSPSINGRIADASNAPIPAVTLTSSKLYPQVFKSASGAGQVVATGKSLNEVLSPFDQKSDALKPDFLTRRAALQATMDRALQSLGSYSRSTMPGADSLYVMRHRAQTLLEKGIGDVASVYSGLVAKYDRLIRLSMSSVIPGISDKAIPNDFSLLRSSLNGQLVAGNSDLRTIITPDATLPNLSQGFAIAEYLLTQRLSSAVVFGTDSLQQMNYENVVSFAGKIPSPCEQKFDFDEHFRGQWISVISHAYIWKAFAACLYEFAGALRHAELFDETVLHVSTEFGRYPNGGLDGSSHGPSATPAIILSGAVKKPMVLGNVFNTYGAGAPVVIENAAQTLSPSHCGNTLCSLLRVKPLSNNSGSLLIENVSGDLQPTIELARNLEG